jgi:hypothetical protein
VHIVDRDRPGAAEQLGAQAGPTSAELPGIKVRRKNEIVVARRILDHAAEEFFGAFLAASRIEQPYKAFMAIGRRSRPIKSLGELRVSALLEELSGLARRAAAQIAGVFAWTIGTVQYFPGCALVVEDGFNLQPVQETTVMEARPRLFAI